MQRFKILPKKMQLVSVSGLFESYNFLLYSLGLEIPILEL
jgi:hypothetical protein